jgi:Bacterial transcriptional activator domain
MMTPAVAEIGPAGRFPAALVYVFSVLLLTGVVVATNALSLGVRTSYGAGIDSGMGSQVQRDFIADQDAEAAALSTNDRSQLAGTVTGKAMEDIIRQITGQAASGASSKVSFQPSSLSILKAQDPSDHTLVIEVQEDGTKTVAGQSTAFHGDFWLRKDASGRYLIADQRLQNRPPAILPALSLVLAAMLAIGAAAVLIWRRRNQPAPAVPDAGATAAVSAAMSIPAIYQPDPDAAPPKRARALIRTFGRLEVHHEGSNWAAGLDAQPEFAFIWARLLVAALADPRGQVARDEVAREVSPRLDGEARLQRLDHVIERGFAELAPALSACIVVGPEALSFNLTGRQVDAVDLATVAADLQGRQTITGQDVARAQQVVDASVGTFLPDFETIEDIVTSRNPTCTALIQQAREWLSRQRLALILLLADSHLAADRAADAIAVVEPAFHSQPNNDDLRARLIDAYSRAGRAEDAAGLELKRN